MADIAVPSLDKLDCLRQSANPVLKPSTSNLVGMTGGNGFNLASVQDGKQASVDSLESAKKKKRTQFTSCDACVRVC